MQKLLDARFFPRAVDVGDLVFWEAAVVLVHLGNNRGDGGDAPGRAVSPRTEQPPPSAMIISHHLKRGSRMLLRFSCLFFPQKRAREGRQPQQLVTVCSVSLQSVSMLRRLRGCVGTCLGREG